MSDGAVFETPAPNNGRKRVYTPVSGFDFRSHKKRRVTLSAGELSLDSPNGNQHHAGPIFQCESSSTPDLDRFISVRPETLVPLTISPRTNRMYKSFGLLGKQRLTYRDENTNPAASAQKGDDGAYGLLRKSASSLMSPPKPANGCSVSQNLAKSRHATLVLDSPGLTLKLFSEPLSWSLDNRIAVACGKDVYYQDLVTRKVTHFFQSGIRYPTKEAVAISWGDQKHQKDLACLNSNGACEVFKIGTTQAITLYSSPPGSTGSEPQAKALSWSGDIIACGMSNGENRFYDVRDRKEQFRLGGKNLHKQSVISLAYNGAGSYLASGDVAGNVHIWDVRAHKTLSQINSSSRIKHRAPAKALAWCSWNPELLATGSIAPEGVIKVWNSKRLNHNPIEPEKTFTLNAAVHSIIWSPHCKEILSVHGSQFQYTSASHRQRRVSTSDIPSSTSSNTGPTTVIQGPLTNSILVHDYPSGKRLMTLTRAHRTAVTAACLSPDGQDVFTASPSEQTIRMWKVWGPPPKRVKETPFASCIIR